MKPYPERLVRPYSSSSQTWNLMRGQPCMLDVAMCKSMGWFQLNISSISAYAYCVCPRYSPESRSQFFPNSIVNLHETPGPNPTPPVISPMKCTSGVMSATTRTRSRRRVSSFDLGCLRMKAWFWMLLPVAAWAASSPSFSSSSLSSSSSSSRLPFWPLLPLPPLFLRCGAAFDESWFSSSSSLSEFRSSSSEESSPLLSPFLRDFFFGEPFFLGEESESSSSSSPSSSFPLPPNSLLPNNPPFFPFLLGVAFPSPLSSSSSSSPSLSAFLPLFRPMRLMNPPGFEGEAGSSFFDSSSSDSSFAGFLPDLARSAESDLLMLSCD
mmetsp:Transcript_18607/g.38042  ORF Transcript_18607/g.38042 Transcript_18607/m.38042 type:complete len:324 (+) Transcript_18607:296-1267(+)